MANFPDADLDVLVQVAWGADLAAAPSTWAFTDLSARKTDDLIDIRRGVVVGSPMPQTSFATVTLTNDDGWLTPELPTSPYWPYVDIGAPARILARSQQDLVDTFTRAAVTNGWGVATSGETWAPFTPSAFSTNGTQGRITHSGISVRLVQSGRIVRDLDLVFDVSASTVATGAEFNAGAYVRNSGNQLYGLFCGIAFAAGGTILLRADRFHPSSNINLAYTTVPSLTYSAGTMIRVRVRVVGDKIQMRAWLASGSEPSTWLVDLTQSGPYKITGFNAAMTVFDNDCIGTQVYPGNTNTLPVFFTFDNITLSQVYSPRIEGYVSDIRPTFIPLADGTAVSTVQLDISGIGSLLERREAPEYSPMRRSIQYAAIPPVAYWPLEDAETSQFGASALPGHPPMVPTGPAVFAFSTGTPVAGEVYLSRYGTQPMVSVAPGARLTASVPAYGVDSEWAVSCMAQFYSPDVPAITEMRILEWETAGGTFNRWALVSVNASTTYQVRAYNDIAGTSTTVITSTVGLSNGQQAYNVEAIQNGANIDLTLYVQETTIRGTGSVAGTLTAVTKIKVNPDRTNTTASVTPSGIRFTVGHVQVSNETTRPDLPYYFDTELGITVNAGSAWYLESAHRRVKRQCDEARVPCTILGTPATTGYTSLNAQQDGSFTPLLTSTVQSESGGLLIEAAFGYFYLPRSARYNLAPTLVVDMATYAYDGLGTNPEDVLVPRLDATGATSWTVQRVNGGTGTYAAPTAYRARRGTIDAQVTVDVLRDADLADHAAWRTHLVVDARSARYPELTVDLAANPALINAWLACEIGARVQRTNQPTIAGLGVIDQVVEGYTEKLGPRTWTAALNATPAAVWDTGVYDSSASKWDSLTTTLGNSPTTTSISFILSTTDAGDIWSTSTPYALIVDGEVVTVTVMSAASGTGPYTQTATVTRSINGVVKAHTAGAEVHVATPGTWAL